MVDQKKYLLGMKKQTDGAVQPAEPSRIDGNLKRTAYGSTGLSVRDFSTRYKLSHDTLTRITGFSLRAISNWVRGSKPSPATSRRFTETKRLFAALERLVSPEAIGPWLKDPNPAFDGSTPLQVIERGETDRVWQMVYELESGEPA
jgi:hypothetical protein